MPLLGVALVPSILKLQASFWFSLGKYAIDLAVLLTVVLARRKKFLAALRDLAANGGNVYDYTRHIKSVLFGGYFEKIFGENNNE